MAAIFRSLCGSYKMAPGLTRASADIGLYQSPSQETPTTTTHSVISFKPHQSINQQTVQTTHLQGRLRRHQSSTKANPVPWSQPLCHHLYSWPFLTTSQPANQSFPLTLQQQSRLNYKSRAYATHTRDAPGAPTGNLRDYAIRPNKKPTT